MAIRGTAGRGALWLVGILVSTWAGAPWVSPLARADPLRVADRSDAGTAPGASPRRGSLDKEVIRRVIRRHVNEVRACYEPELARVPTLGGRVMVQFTIEASGIVGASTLQSSTMGNTRVETCIVQAVRRWEFPEPLGGGSVIVSYPFVLTPASKEDPPPGVQFEWLVPDRLLIHRARDPIAGTANGLIAVTDRGLILIDAAWTDAQTEEILRYGQYVLDRRWLGAVITHDHRDRAGGIAAIRAFGIPIAALDLTVAKLEKRGVRGIKPLFAAAAGSFKDDRGFEVFYPGPAHASDNIVVAFPAWNVVFGGCMLRSADATDLGFTADADLKAWSAAVRRVEQRYPTPAALIPGHGPVDHSASAYRHTLDLLARRASRVEDP